MKMKIIASILVLISASATTQIGGLDARNADKWKFELYPAAADFTGRPAEPILATPHEHLMRTQIRTQASQGPNFAGDFTIAKWGCGSPCVAFVIVDARSGIIYDPGFSVACADDNGVEAKVDFKLTSRLVVATGLSKESKEVVCGDDFYQWDGKRLIWIHFEPWPSNH